MKLKVKILIVDDEQDYCLIMKHYFSSKNAHADLAHTLTDGLSMLQEIKPDILLLDNNLPDGEGWNHVQEIAAAFPSMKIYLISAYKSVKDNHFNSPNVHVWEKPISRAKLDEIILN